MAVILIAGTTPVMPSLYKSHTVHLVSNTSKLWTTIALLRPSLIIMDDSMENFNARKFCRDCKQNKSSLHVAIILLSDTLDLPGYADAILRRPLDEEKLHTTIKELLTQ